MLVRYKQFLYDPFNVVAMSVRLSIFLFTFAFKLLKAMVFEEGLSFGHFKSSRAFLKQLFVFKTVLSNGTIYILRVGNFNITTDITRSMYTCILLFRGT